MELCGWCKKCTGTNQLYHQLSDGSREPSIKLCGECYGVFKTPSKKLQRIMKKSIDDVSCKPSAVLTKGEKMITCEVIALTEWICAGWTVVGIADSYKGLLSLYEIATGMK